MLERSINRYYDPATDQFLSVDPLVAQTGQPYVFTGDNPLNATDPLGLEIYLGGNGTCNTQENNSGVGTTFCHGQSSGGRNAPGIVLTLPTVEFTVMVGSVTVASSVEIFGQSNVSFGNGFVTVSAGGSSETFNSDGSVSGSLGLPGAPGLSVSSNGLSYSTTTNTHLGNDHVQVQTTATFYPESMNPPTLSDVVIGGSVLAGAPVVVAGVVRFLEWLVSNGGEFAY